MLDPVIHKTITYVQNLEEKDLKDKVVFLRTVLYSLPQLQWEKVTETIIT